MNIRRKYPALFVHGHGEIPPLGAEEERTATRDERIRSVWPLLVRNVLRFEESLKPRERANFDAEDAIGELWVKLAEKDSLWVPERGRYYNFAASVCNTTLDRLRDRARTVKTPGNSSGRLRKYKEKEDAGTLKPGEARTMNDLKRAVSGKLACAGHDTDQGGVDVASDGHPPDQTTIRRDERQAASADVAFALAILSPSEASALGAIYGLWGQPQSPLPVVAAAQGKSLAKLRDLTAAAVSKLRIILEERKVS